MPQCEFYTVSLARCSRNCAAGTPYCRTHTPKAELLLMLGPRPAEGHCLCVRRVAGEERWCGQPHREGETICTWHWQRVRARVAREQQQQAMVDLAELTLNAYLDLQPRLTWMEIARHVRTRTQLPRDHPSYLPGGVAFSVARRYFLRTTPETTPVHVFVDFWVNRAREERDIWVAEAAPEAPPVQPQGQMQRLAADAQNVHTGVVSTQTNTNVDLLLAEPPSAGIDTLTTLTRWWMTVGQPPAFESYWRLIEDVRHWYGKRTCKSVGDFLYQRVLTGLVSKVAKLEGELFEELVKRLWEECEEAVGMCCEGHISRLANVLVGFDNAFRPPVPVGEILQTKMAAIAELKLSTAVKLQKAVAVLDELNIPVDDRAPWLEALEE